MRGQNGRAVLRWSAGERRGGHWGLVSEYWEGDAVGWGGGEKGMVVVAETGSSAWRLDAISCGANGVVVRGLKDSLKKLHSVGDSGRHQDLPFAVPGAGLAADCGGRRSCARRRATGAAHDLPPLFLLPVWLLTAVVAEAAHDNAAGA